MLICVCLVLLLSVALIMLLRGIGEKGFDAKLLSVDVGMTKAEVEKILGKPDDILTPSDHFGTWSLGTSETWGYGTTVHRGFATKGVVYFDEEGRVQYVYGATMGKLKPK